MSGFNKYEITTKTKLAQVPSGAVEGSFPCCTNNFPLDFIQNSQNRTRKIRVCCVLGKKPNQARRIDFFKGLKYVF